MPCSEFENHLGIRIIFININIIKVNIIKTFTENTHLTTRKCDTTRIFIKVIVSKWLSTPHFKIIPPTSRIPPLPPPPAPPPYLTNKIGHPKFPLSAEMQL